LAGKTNELSVYEYFIGWLLGCHLVLMLMLVVGVDSRLLAGVWVILKRSFLSEDLLPFCGLFNWLIGY